MRWKRNKNDQNNQKEESQISAPLILNSQSQIEGDFTIETNLRIDGTVQGNVCTTKSVIIGEHGHLRGKLKCKCLTVFGTFEGISEVSESTSLQATSRFNGELTSPVISTFPGCFINANINREQAPTSGLESESQIIPFPVQKNDQKTQGSVHTKSDATQENITSKKGNSFLFNSLNNK